ncbi:HAD hydrolase-like protein [Arthrobacter alpinus]|nr:HAD hydrolase-like protein [Arthrobacter alpinus]
MSADILLTAFDAVLADLDGVVYAGPAAIPGAIDALNGLAEKNVKLAYVTNNASRTPAQVAAHLRDLGAPADDDQVVSSAQAGAALLATKFPAGSKVLVTGSAALAQEVLDLGMKVVASAQDAPDVVIQGFDPALGWVDLAEATFAIKGGAAWIATNTDMTIPRDRGSLPVTGPWSQRCAPPSDLIRWLLASLKRPCSIQPPIVWVPRRPWWWGDRLDTDILGGNNAGMATALVLTGVDSGETALRACTAERPTFIIPTLKELYSAYPAIEFDGATVTCGAAAATVTRGSDGESVDTVHITGTTDDPDAWRAACAAWWAAVPRADAATTPVITWHSTLP